MAKRIIFGGVFFVVSIGMLIYSITTGILFICACGIISAYEINKTFRNTGRNSIAWPGYVFCILAAAGMITGKRNEVFIFFMPFLSLAVLTHTVIFRKTKPSDVLLGMGICFFPLLPIVFIMYMLSSGSDFAPAAFVTATVATVFCDSFALFTGKAFGKHKLAPLLSPNKTIEGLIGGLLFGSASGILVYYSMSAIKYPVFSLHFTLFAAFLATVAGTIGDLAASSIKREAGIKEYSKLIPGHGGMMDRIDSMIFAIPIVYMISIAFGYI